MKKRKLFIMALREKIIFWLDILWLSRDWCYTPIMSDERFENTYAYDDSNQSMEIVI